MGVRGLTKFLKEGNFFESEDLCLTNPKTFVVDSNNFICETFMGSKGIKCCLGGDMDKFKNTLELIFSNCEKLGISLIMIQDGVPPPEKTNALMDRKNTYLKRSLNPSFGTALPGGPFAQKVFFKVCQNSPAVKGLYKMRYEADPVIAKIAAHFSLPVLSNDSDFLVYNVELHRISEFVDSVKAGGDIIPSTFFNRKKFLKYYNITDEKILWLLASIVGNDYISSDVTSPMLSQISIPTSKSSGNMKRIKAVLLWLSKEKNSTEALKKILNFFKNEKRIKIKDEISQSMNLYDLFNDQVEGLNDTSLKNIESFIFSIKSTSPAFTKTGILIPQEIVEKSDSFIFDSWVIISLVKEEFHYNFPAEDARQIDSITFNLPILEQFFNILYTKLGVEKNIRVYSRNGRSLATKTIQSLLLDDIDRTRILGSIGIEILDDSFFSKEWGIFWASCSYFSFQKKSKILLPFLAFFILKTSVNESSIKRAYSSKCTEDVSVSSSDLPPLFPLLEPLNDSDRKSLLSLVKFFWINENSKLNTQTLHWISVFDVTMKLIDNLNVILDYPFNPFIHYDIINHSFLYNMNAYLSSGVNPKQAFIKLFKSDKMKTYIQTILHKFEIFM